MHKTATRSICTDFLPETRTITSLKTVKSKNDKKELILAVAKKVTKRKDATTALSFFLPINHALTSLLIH